VVPHNNPDTMKNMKRSLYLLLTNVLLCMLTHSNCFSQTTVDLSAEFKKIDTYNSLIQSANSYHYDEQGRMWKNAGICVGVAACGITSLVLIFKEDSNLLLGAAMGLPAGLLLRGYDSSEYYWRYEYEQIDQAKALFKRIPNP